MAILELKDLTIWFKGLKAVSEVNFQIKEHEIFGLIGPNGAGKTTVFNMITGVYKPSSGNIFAFGQDITSLPPYKINSKGVARTFQNIRLFKQLSVLDNLLIALDHNPTIQQAGMVSSILQNKTFRDSESQKLTKAHELLEMFQLSDRAKEEACNLPYGDQRRLEIARAMATNAKLILLDEPAAGLNPQESKTLMNTIRQIRDQWKMTVLLIEHDMKVVMGICDRIAVLEYGNKIAEGTPLEIQKHEKVIEAYLGKAKD